ncbi:MAG: hypothetical protein ACF8R7_04920 [Phycisphaerales bacterium JB039]
MRALPRVMAIAAAGAVAACVPAEPRPHPRPAPRNIAPTRVTLMLLETRDSDFDLAPDTFVLDIVLFSEFESPLPVRPSGSMRFELVGADDAVLGFWEVPAPALAAVQRKTALGLDGYRVSLSMRAAGIEDDVPPQGARVRAVFTPEGVDGPAATGETPVRLGFSQ